MFKGSKRQSLDLDKITAQLNIGENFVLKSNVQVFEELNGGVVLYASLVKEVGYHSAVIEKYKIIVEPPTFWERLVGTTINSKINKAVKAIMKLSQELLYQDVEPSTFKFNSVMPGFKAFVF